MPPDIWMLGLLPHLVVLEGVDIHVLRRQPGKLDAP